MRLIRTLLASVRSEVKLLRKRVRHSYPVYLSARCQVHTSGRSYIGSNAVIDVAELILGEEVSIGSRARIEGQKVKIARRTNINRDCKIYMGQRSLGIGSYCAISNGVSFWGVDHNLGLPAVQVRFYKQILGLEYQFADRGDICIGNDVLIGEKAIIMPGITIGDGAVIGASSVVTRAVEPYAIVAGIPARLVKERFSEEIRRFLLKLKWWEWKDDVLRQNREFFGCNLNALDSVSEIEKKLSL
jgi:virginiamycin A acetyltransferase